MVYLDVFGANALCSTVAGQRNTVVGADSFLSNQTGDQNTGLGLASMWQSTGSNNVALGYQAGSDTTSGSNKIVIGHTAQPSSATASNEITLGNSSIACFRIPGLNYTIDNGGDVTLANDKKVIFGDAGEYISGDGTNLTITSSGQTTIDSTSTINLDADDGNIYLKDGGTLFGYLARSGNNLHIKSQISDGDFIIQGNDGGSTVVALTLDMSEAGTATFNHDILPTTDATQDLGSTSKRWNNIYTGDLHLSNESTKSGNSIDGTKGNWTLQEGQSDLFLINNNTGKKYKFKIEEIE